MSDKVEETLNANGKLSRIGDFLLRLVREKPLGTVGGIITLILLLTGIFAGFLAPYGMNKIHPADALSPPSAQYLLGTDNMGRDILSRVIYGARISVIVGLSASAIATIGASIIGIISGYIGGRFDIIVQRLVDTVMCIPSLVLTLSILAITGPGMLQIILVLGLSWAIGSSRIIRSAVLSVKENVYVQAALATGCTTVWILFRHIFHNIIAPIIVVFSIQLPGIILTEASLSFLGFGIPPPAPSWGGMLSGDSRSYMFLSPWMVIWPGLALTIVVYSVNMFGDALRDILDPKLKGGVGRYDSGIRRKKKESVKISV